MFVNAIVLSVSIPLAIIQPIYLSLNRDWKLIFAYVVNGVQMVVTLWNSRKTSLMITIIVILDITCCSLSYLEQKISGTEFCPRL
jgi:hypothetical protein